MEAFVSPREAHMPDFPPEPMNGAERAPATGASSAEPAAEAIVPVETAAPEPAAPAPQPIVPRKPTEVVITEADPDRPKKGGWWQRVRTPFGG